jgi:hypothetical protein
VLYTTFESTKRSKEDQRITALGEINKDSVIILSIKRIVLLQHRFRTIQFKHSVVSSRVNYHDQVRTVNTLQFLSTLRTPQGVLPQTECQLEVLFISSPENI